MILLSWIANQGYFSQGQTSSKLSLRDKLQQPGPQKLSGSPDVGVILTSQTYTAAFIKETRTEILKYLFSLLCSYEIFMLILPSCGIACVQFTHGLMSAESYCF